MDALNGLEKTISGWYKGVPHLPKGFTQWLADNIWWLVIIGVVLSVLSLFALVPLALFAFGLSAGVATSIGYVDGGLSAGAFGVAWLSVLLSLVALIVTTVLEAFAISPLKNKAKLGWSLLFAVALFNLLFNIAASIVTVNVFGVVTGVLWAAVWGYFLFEIRSYFGAKKAAPKKS